METTNGGTAVTTREQARALQRQVPAGTLHPELAAQLAERKALAKMAAAIAGQAWGKGLDRDTAYAVARYCQTQGIDPMSELDVLGGRLYKNANYYQRRGAELIAAGVVERIEVDHVEADKRLEAFAESPDAAQREWAVRERWRRLQTRVEQNADERAAAVVVVRVWLRGMRDPIVGCNWCGNGIRGKNDPIGDEQPSKTAETRAARRAWKQLMTAVPALAHGEAIADEEGAPVEEVIQTARARARAESAESQRALPASPTQGRALAGQVGGFAYPEDDAPAAASVPAPKPGKVSDAIEPARQREPGEEAEEEYQNDPE